MLTVRIINLIFMVLILQNFAFGLAQGNIEEAIRQGFLRLDEDMIKGMCFYLSFFK